MHSRKARILRFKVFEFSSYSTPQILNKKMRPIKRKGYDYVAPSNKKIKRLIDDIVAGNLIQHLH